MKNTLGYIRHICAVLLCVVLAAPGAGAQRQRNNIYLFDCTQSMQELGIWDAAKTALGRTVDVQAAQPEALFTVIPFQGTVHPAFSFDAAGRAKYQGEIEKACDKYITNRTNTNIVDALQAGFDRCRPELDNRVYLLTDGTDNVKKTPAVVALINKWCASHVNARLFYVTLDEKAVDPAIRAAIDACDDAFMVNCHKGVIPQIADITPNEIYANTLELDAIHRILFSEPGDYALSLRCSDPFFTPVLEGTGAGGQLLRVKISPRDASLPIEELNALLADATDAQGNYCFTFDVLTSDPRALAIANPTVEVTVSNRRPRKLSLAALGSDETVIKPGSESHPAFLFSAEKLPDVVEIDLAPEFNDAAAAAGSAAAFTLAPAHGQPLDFDVLFNGTPVGAGESFTLEPGKPGRLAIVFAPEAQTGKRYFELKCCGTHLLEMLNDAPADRPAALGLRTSYSRNWNPLATVLFWLGVALLAALVLWFAVLRRIFYPRFTISSVEFTGPGSYYVRKKVKGYRKLVLTSRRYNQGLLSRLFTGPVLAVRAEEWAPEINIEPGRKRTARVVDTKGWDFVPGRTLKRFETYELINSASGAKSKLTVE